VEVFLHTVCVHPSFCTTRLMSTLAISFSRYSFRLYLDLGFSVLLLAVGIQIAI
jgi:hypothetical protein